MARVKEEDRKVADRPLSVNLNNLLSRPPGFTRNLEHIEKTLGIGQRAVRKWITGDRNPSLMSLQSVCELYDFEIGLLFEPLN